MSIDKIKSAAEQIMSRVPAVKGKGEVATKQAMIMPMLQAMGYDIWNPLEVCPEYEADFAKKKSAGHKEKVDIAILKDGKPIIFLEIKSVDINLDGHEGQLDSYFTSTKSVSLAILTNGIEWRLYTDITDENRMDKQPFHICRLDAAEQGLDVLERFCRDTFDGDKDKIREYASELKYADIIAKLLQRNLDMHVGEPSESFIRWILFELREGKHFIGLANASNIARFRPIINDAWTRTIRVITRRLISAMDNATVPVPTPPPPPPIVETVDSPVVVSAQKKVATEEDLAFYAAIEEIFNRSRFNGGTIKEPGRSGRGEIPIELGHKDTTAYLGIYFNKPGWWFLRAMLDGNNKWIGFDLPEDVALPLMPESMKVLPKTTFAPIRVAFNGLDDLNILEPVILAAMERNVWQRANWRQANAQEAEGAVAQTDQE